MQRTAPVARLAGAMWHYGLATKLRFSWNCKMDAFAAQIQLGRAVVGWRLSELGLRISATQRAFHNLEQGGMESRRAVAEKPSQTEWR